MLRHSCKPGLAVLTEEPAAAHTSDVLFPLLDRPLEAKAESLPHNILMAICDSLSSPDLLAMRLVCKSWRSIPGLQMKHIHVPLQVVAQAVPRYFSNIFTVFPNLHAVTLSSCYSLAAHCSFHTLCNQLQSFQHLATLRLLDFPVFAEECSLAGAWKIHHVTELKQLRSIEMSIRCCASATATEGDVHTAQDRLLLNVLSLQQVTAVAVQLPDSYTCISIGLGGYQDDAEDEDLNDLEGILQAEKPKRPEPCNSISLPAGSLPNLAVSGSSYLLTSNNTWNVANYTAQQPDSALLDAVDLDFTEPFQDTDMSPGRHFITNLALQATLQELRLSNVVLRHRDIASILSHLPALTCVHLQGRLGWSRLTTHAVRQLVQLQQLHVGEVQLIYAEDDADGSPESLMSDLYGVLEALPKFSTLSFKLADMDHTRYMHSAYLLGLYDYTGLAGTLTSLYLGTVVFDSDYSLDIVGSLIGLTSLQLEYQTWPLSLAANDWTRLSTLTRLHTLHLRNSPEEAHFLLELSNNVVKVLSAHMLHLGCFHYSGVINGDLPALSTWGSLQDLSLTYVTDSSLACGPTHTALGDHAAAAAQTCRAHSNNSDNNILTWLLSDRHCTTSGAAVQTGLRCCLSYSLRKLALSGVHVTLADMRHIATHLTHLSELQMVGCATTPYHLLILTETNNPPPLEVLVMYDAPDQGATAPELAHSANEAIITGEREGDDSPTDLESNCLLEQNTQANTATAESKVHHVAGQVLSSQSALQQHPSTGCSASFKDPCYLWCCARNAAHRKNQSHSCVVWWEADAKAIARAALAMVGQQYRGLRQLMLRHTKRT